MRPDTSIAARRAIYLAPTTTDRLIQECRPSSIAVFLAITTSAYEEKSVREIASQTGLDRKTVYNALRELVQAGVLVIEPQNGKPSLYRRVTR